MIATLTFLPESLSLNYCLIDWMRIRKKRIPDLLIQHKSLKFLQTSFLSLHFQFLNLVEQKEILEIVNLHRLLFFPTRVPLFLSFPPFLLEKYYANKPFRSTMTNPENGGKCITNHWNELFGSILSCANTINSQDSKK